MTPSSQAICSNGWRARLLCPADFLHGSKSKRTAGNALSLLQAANRDSQQKVNYKKLSEPDRSCSVTLEQDNAIQTLLEDMQREEVKTAAMRDQCHSAVVSAYSKEESLQRQVDDLKRQNTVLFNLSRRYETITKEIKESLSLACRDDRRSLAVYNSKGDPARLSPRCPDACGRLGDWRNSSQVEALGES
eukprot:765232-Hanusia_phi.AAC.13